MRGARCTRNAFAAEGLGFSGGFDKEIGGGIAVEECRKVAQRALENFALEEMRCSEVSRITRKTTHVQCIARCGDDLGK
jgi:hypothetical protein